MAKGAVNDFATPSPAGLVSLRPNSTGATWLARLAQSASRQRLVIAASILASGLICLQLLGTPVGEPVADDLTFLAAQLRGETGLLSGGGSRSFWRPIPHQIYYGLLSGPLLQQPIVAAVVNAVTLLLIGLAVGLLASRFMPRPAASVVAFCAIAHEYSRTMIAWPSHFVELSMLLSLACSALAASRGHFGWFMVASAIALLCKETSVLYLTALFIGRWWLIGVESRRPRRLALFASLLAAWGLLYRNVVTRHAMHPPDSITTEPGAVLSTMVERAGWSLRRVLEFISGDDGAGTMRVAVVATLLASLMLIGVVLELTRRRKAAGAAPTPLVPMAVVVGLLGTLALLPTYPIWAPHRAYVPYIAILMIAVAGLARVHKWAPLLLVAGSIASILVATPGPRSIGVLPPTTGRFIDYPRLVRLQRFMRSARELLRTEVPALAPGSLLAQRNFPVALSYALSGDDAIRVWYGDSTLGWIGVDALGTNHEPRLAGVVDFSPDHGGTISFVPAAVYRDYATAVEQLRGGLVPEAYGGLSRTIRWSEDHSQDAFGASALYWRAVALVRMDRAAEALNDASLAVRASLVEADARFLRALILADMGRIAEARAECRALLAADPGHAEARSLLASLNR